ncbi:hypothetical protein Rhsp01_38310 [Rhizobium sp. NBRC 114257]|uniref:Uncharacterized protein n=1 Tax=Rhizobium dioscoreae TaxID=2653122 RepID=A0ABQ0Z757_9HYPH|nr:hypothetical protein RsS93_38170 [Rhizobium dioscoreae]GLU82655.1 hypothetical protein Rhsp01_38310 [Rhizobium sp. NBRC 114257]
MIAGEQANPAALLDRRKAAAGNFGTSILITARAAPFDLWHIHEMVHETLTT